LTERNRALSAPSWADSWKLQKYPNDRFQVEWSGPVAITSTDLNSSTKKLIDHSNTYVQVLNSSALLVTATLANPTTKISVENTAKGSFSNKECKKIDKHSIDVNKAQAVEWVGTDCKLDWRVRSRFFNKGPWLYEVTFLGLNDDVVAGQHFVESFKIIDN
jgi:hypothetical protein